MSTPFTGDRKEPLVSPLAAIEDRFIRALLPRFPRWVRGDHLTWMTVAWSLGVVLAGWLARSDVRWLWLSSAMLVLQWFTDSFDGKLGKLRGLGLRRWGYFMDHFLDYVFMACVMGHYAFITQEPASTLFLILVPLYGGFEVNSWLEFGATGKFRITYGFVGPTEVRLIFVAVNTAIIFAGVGWLEAAMPYVLAVLAIGLIGIVHGTQRRIRAQDMAEKAQMDVTTEETIV